MLLVLLLAFPLGGAEEDRFNDILKYFEAKDVNSRDSSLLRSDNKNGFSRSLEEQVFISGKQDQPRGGAKAQQQGTVKRLCNTAYRWALAIIDNK